MSEPMLVLDSIGKSFGRRRVLSSATVHASPGRVTALLGRNGCGKSTLMKIAIGEHAADHGVIRFDGQWVRRPRLHRLAVLGLFYLPERGLIVGSSTIGARIDAIARRFGGRTVEEVVSRLRLDPLLDRPPEQLSTGERRRAELALALIRAPRCMLADEPLMGLAPRDADDIAAALRELAAGGCGLIVTGHEVRVLLDTADEVVWVVAGTTHALGPPEEAVRNRSFVRDYLSGPETTSTSKTAVRTTSSRRV